MDLLKKYRVKSPHFKREWHFHILLCEEIKFSIPRVKMMASYFSQSFFHTKGCGNAQIILEHLDHLPYPNDRSLQIQNFKVCNLYSSYK